MPVMSFHDRRRGRELTRDTLPDCGRARPIRRDDRHVGDRRERFGWRPHDVGKLRDDLLREQLAATLGEGLGLRGTLDSDRLAFGLTFGLQCFRGGDAAVALRETLGDGCRGGCLRPRDDLLLRDRLGQGADAVASARPRSLM